MSDDADRAADHLRMCKQRALEYFDAGDIPNAIASMVSDLSKYDREVQMSERASLFAEVQAVLGGHSESEVMQALLQSLVVVVGVSAPDIDRAEAMLDALPAELKPLLRKDWAKYRQHRADAEATPTH